MTEHYDIRYSEGENEGWSQQGLSQILSQDLPCSRGARNSRIDNVDKPWGFLAPYCIAAGLDDMLGKAVVVDATGNNAPELEQEGENLPNSVRVDPTGERKGLAKGIRQDNGRAGNSSQLPGFPAW